MTVQQDESDQSAAAEEVTCCGDLHREVIKWCDALWTNLLCSSAHPHKLRCNNSKTKSTTRASDQTRPDQPGTVSTHPWWVRNHVQSSGISLKLFYFIAFTYKRASLRHKMAPDTTVPMSLFSRCHGEDSAVRRKILRHSKWIRLQVWRGSVSNFIKAKLPTEQRGWLPWTPDLDPRPPTCSKSPKFIKFFGFCQLR